MIRSKKRTEFLRIIPISFVKYVIVGTSNAAFTLAVYLLFLKVLRLDYILSFSLSWLLGVFFTYVINFLWVFKPDQKLEFKKRLWKYVAVYACSYAVNVLLLRLVVEKFAVDPLYAQLILIPLVIVVNYFGMKYWALSKGDIKLKNAGNYPEKS